VFQDRPALDFLGFCTTVAIKSGGSKEAHLDWGDDPNSYASLTLLGRGWKGGRLDFPQLGVSIPTYPGIQIWFQARSLIHLCTEVEGDRVCVTSFWDANIVADAIKRMPELKYLMLG